MGSEAKKPDKQQHAATPITCQPWPRIRMHARTCTPSQHPSHANLGHASTHTHTHPTQGWPSLPSSLPASSYPVLAYSSDPRLTLRKQPHLDVTRVLTSKRRQRDPSSTQAPFICIRVSRPPPTFKDKSDDKKMYPGWASHLRWNYISRDAHQIPSPIPTNLTYQK